MQNPCTCTCLQFGLDKTGNCAFSQSLNEDIKPQINFGEAFGGGSSASSQNGGHMSEKSGSSDDYSSYEGSEEDDSTRAAKVS